jgi:GTP-binding protein
VKIGAQPGAAVTIGDVTFDFEPTKERDYVPTRRGYDERLDMSTRARAPHRLEAKRGRRTPLAEGEVEISDSDDDIEGTEDDE